MATFSVRASAMLAVRFSAPHQHRMPRLASVRGNFQSTSIFALSPLPLPLSSAAPPYDRSSSSSSDRITPQAFITRSIICIASFTSWSVSVSLFRLSKLILPLIFYHLQTPLDAGHFHSALYRETLLLAPRSASGPPREPLHSSSSAAIAKACSESSLRSSTTPRPSSPTRTRMCGHWRLSRSTASKQSTPRGIETRGFPAHLRSTPESSLLVHPGWVLKTPSAPIATKV